MTDNADHSALKDAVKAINTAFSADTVPAPLPDELQRTIEDFLERRQDADSQKLQEELLLSYTRYAGVGTEKQHAFANLLTLLLPAIASKDSLQEWWNMLIKPTLDTIGNKRDAIESTKELLLSVLVLDGVRDSADDSGLSAYFIRQTLDAYFARTKIPSRDEDVVSPEDEFIAHEWETVLVTFGKKRSRELLLAVDEYLEMKDYRLQSLSLLSSFVRLQPPHLHLVLETPLVQHLLNCLLIDTSSTVVDLALTNLIMFIPHITSSLVSILPKLFLVYSRVLCWDQYYKKTPESAETPDDADDATSPDGGGSVFDIDETWEQLQSCVDTVDALSPQANYLFTFLYGLFPINFMTFVRKPRRYLKAKAYPRADDLDLRQGLIRTRTESHRAVHLLHSNFFTTTLEDELTDNRWLKTDPADLVTECMSLCIAVSHTLNDPGPPPTSKLPDIPKTPNAKQIAKADALLASDEDAQTYGTTSAEAISASSRNTQSTVITIPSVGPSTNLSPVDAHKSSRTSLRDQLARSRNNSPGKTDGNDGAEKSPTSREPNQSSRPSSSNGLHRLQGFAHTVSRSPHPHSPLSASGGDSNVALQREIMLLKNDLNFERYLKQQHISHIATLQRRSVSEATAASETENLFNANKVLKARLIKANEFYSQLKRETNTSKNQTKKYEEQLSSKLKAYREEEKRWQAEAEQLHHELEKAQRETEHLKNLIVESELREQHTRNKLITLQRDYDDLSTLRTTLGDAEAKLQKYELRDLEFQRAQEDHELLRNEFETLKMELTSRDANHERMKKTYDQKISVLEARVRTAQGTLPAGGPLPASMQQMMDLTLAASNAKLQQLKRAHARLLQRYTELELRNLELDAPDAGAPPQKPSQLQHQQLARPSVSAGGATPLPPRPNSVLSLTRFADDIALAPGAGVASLGGNGISSTALLRRNSTRATTSAGIVGGPIAAMTAGGGVRRVHAFADPAFFEENLLPANDDVSQTPLSKGVITASLDRAGAQPPPPPLPLQPTMPSLKTHDFQASQPLDARSIMSAEGGVLPKDKTAVGPQSRVYGRGKPPSWCKLRLTGYAH